jgi:DNA-binding transcriptional ArsR family regulator
MVLKRFRQCIKGDDFLLWYLISFPIVRKAKIRSKLRTVLKNEPKKEFKFMEDRSEEMKKLATEFLSCQDAFIALGDETRIHMVIEMLQAGETRGIRVGEICRMSNLSRPAVSHHMKYLKQSGIVKVRKEGTKNYYYLDANNSKLAEIITLCTHAEHLAATAPDLSK